MNSDTPITSALAGFLHGEKAHREIRESYNYLAERLLVITGIYHDETAGHLQRMGSYCRFLAAAWGRTEDEQPELDLTIRRAKFWELAVIPFKHIDPGYRLSAWLGGISLALGVLSLVLSIVLSS